MSKTHLVVFATEGPPGIPLLEEARTFSLLAESEGGVDVSHIFTPARMIEGGYAWTVKSRNEDEKLEGDENPTYHHIGLGAWVFACISMALAKASPGDLVIYHTVSIKKYPTYIASAKRLKRLAEATLNFHETSGPHGVFGQELVGSTAKYELLVHAADGDTSLAARAAHLSMQRLNFLAMRHTPETCEFVDRLISQTRDFDSVTLSPKSVFKGMQPHGVVLYRHTADQAVFNAYHAVASISRAPKWYIDFATDFPIGTTYNPIGVFQSRMYVGQKLDAAERPTLRRTRLTSPSGRFHISFNEKGVIWKDTVSNKVLRVGDARESSTVPVSLELEKFGICIHDEMTKTYVATWTSFRGSAAYAVMQNDGNFVVISRFGVPIWHSDTYTLPGVVTSANS